MSLAYENRKESILKLLEKDGKIYVPNIAKMLNVSSETIRRDLDRLEQEGQLKKVYGGAVVNRTLSVEPAFDQKISMNTKEKQIIGKLAASLIVDGDVIMIGNGTTALNILDYIDNRKNLTLITHSTPVMLKAMQHFNGELIFIGGKVDVKQQSTHGPLAEMELSQLKANKAFISVGGISTTDGITDYDLNEASMSRLLMQRSEESIVLADNSKIGLTTFAHICDLKHISTFVTNDDCPTGMKQALDENGISLLSPGSVNGSRQ
ncbi:DeoR/GlpR family DNA-binding transcription regulator [Sporolactobacillus laevolacticus]|uniref:DeoR family transcripitonal regulator n=1 Tax=Sporolactobacillus laevolacticus DSM 442 TaxID=1395513 RepID=V6IYW2_9BACL|nr:DeoR/GlpR family DNA-binding transcription regulator [Sporolactobacillus laevolacticus]EST12678.1 DeoR family transcripitonal regulator [Sporolactobacillus laevolacticus DSM 442]